METFDEILDYEKEEKSINHYVTTSGKRLANFILDRIGIYIVIFALTGLSSLFSGVASKDLYSTAFVILFVLCMPAYYIVPEFLWGKTPAKFITKTSVITIHGGPPTFLNIVGRTLCRYIPFEAFSFLGARAIGWHDTISKTRVVEDAFLE